jgi:hypothetical protein
MTEVTLDFTLDKYAQLCETIRALDCPVMTVRAFLKAGQPGGLRVILRHDVDRRMDAALRMAELESNYEIAATYYVRTTRAVFKPEALQRLHQLGHEVGYHYEVLAKAKGDEEEAIALFEQELKRFREIVPVATVSMHGSPLSRWDNLDLWRASDVGDYGILGDAVLSIDSQLYYLTDTGRSWDAGKYNLRDHLASRQLPRKVDTTDDLIAFLKETPGYPIYISAHPNRWAANWFEWGVGATSDWAINRAKWAIALTRSGRN